MSDAKKDKEARARVRACFDLEVTHLRTGDWQDPRGSEVTYLGSAKLLHGTACTCCPKRYPAAVAS